MSVRDSSKPALAFTVNVTKSFAVTAAAKLCFAVPSIASPTARRSRSGRANSDSAGQSADRHVAVTQSGSEGRRSEVVCSAWQQSAVGRVVETPLRHHGRVRLINAIRSDRAGGKWTAESIAIEPEQSAVARLDWEELSPTSVRACGAPSENPAKVLGVQRDHKHRDRHQIAGGEERQTACQEFAMFATLGANEFCKKFVRCGFTRGVNPHSPFLRKFVNVVEARGLRFGLAMNPPRRRQIAPLDAEQIPYLLLGGKP